MKAKVKKYVCFAVIAFIIIFILFVYINKNRMGYVLLDTKAGRNLIEFFIEKDYKNSIYDDKYDTGEIHINEDLDISKDYTNIALFGVDSREGNLGINSHSDSIIVLSINNITGDTKMLSVYRDTFVQFYKGDSVQYNQASTANYYGGAVAAVNMLNKMLDLNITDYITVNFAGLANIIDALEGIDIEINEDEMNLINGYLTETREVTGLESPDVTTYGRVHLNGLQATAYCRNRYTAFTKEDGTVVEKDYARSERQRKIQHQQQKN